MSVDNLALHQPAFPFDRALCPHSSALTKKGVYQEMVRYSLSPTNPRQTGLFFIVGTTLQ